MTDAFVKLLVGAATALPPLLAWSQPPTPTALNQLAACVLWSATCAVIGTRGNRGLDPRQAVQHPRAANAQAAALTVAALGILLSWHLGLATSLAASALALVMLCLGLGMAANASGALGLAWGCVIAGAASTFVALIQVTAPAAWSDATWIARSPLEGRAVGNLRQPNHLASVLLLASVAMMSLASIGRWRRRWACALLAWFMLGVVLSASRTGYLGVGVLALWGVADRRLEVRWRWVLISSPLLLAGCWLGLELWASSASAPFAASARLREADVSGARFGIWLDSLDLVSAQRWAGVGWGQFNFAWTLTPFPGRSTALFDHAHSLPLHLIAELGVPAGTLLCALLALALWHAGRRAWLAGDDRAVLVRGLFVMLALMALHSLLEYPLWYAYFLLPTAFAMGVCSSWPRSTSAVRARPSPGDTPPSRSTGDRASTPGRCRDVSLPASPRLFAGGVMALAISTYALVDYLRISSIFTPGPHTQGVEQRIAAGRRSLFFAHHADYARATTAEHPGEVMDSFDVAKYHLLDTRLMMAWARAYAERGDLDRARYIAERLREFRNPASKDFLAACAGDPYPRPFQCDPPSRQLTWHDFAGKQ